MGRQPFRQMKSDGTMEEAGASSGGGGAKHLTYTRSGDSGGSAASTYHAMPALPASGTNSFSSTDPFYYAGVVHFVPLYSASGGTLDRLVVYAGASTATAGEDDYQLAVYDSADNGHPTRLLSTPVTWTPASTFGSTQLIIYDTDGSSKITLDANTWYYVAWLGANATNGGNVVMRTVSSTRVQPLQMVGAANYNNQIRWKPTVEDFPSTLTISGSNEFIYSQTNNVPYLTFKYVIDANKSWG
jgi:hypothetical protein